MILVMYNAEQDALRLFDTVRHGWIDMLDAASIYSAAFCTMDITPLIVYGWELIGEL